MNEEHNGNSCFKQYVVKLGLKKLFVSGNRTDPIFSCRPYTFLSISGIKMLFFFQSNSVKLGQFVFSNKLSWYTL